MLLVHEFSLPYPILTLLGSYNIVITFSRTTKQGLGRVKAMKLRAERDLLVVKFPQVFISRRAVSKLQLSQLAVVLVLVIAVTDTLVDDAVCSFVCFAIVAVT
jgi:hypothetical protein